MAAVHYDRGLTTECGIFLVAPRPGTTQRDRRERFTLAGKYRRTYVAPVLISHDYPVSAGGNARNRASGGAVDAPVTCKRCLKSMLERRVNIATAKEIELKRARLDVAEFRTRLT